MKITAQELRIGNWVTESNVTHTGIKTNDKQVNIRDLMYLDNCKPIPLTVEWLELFGFTPDSHKLVYDHPSPEVPEDEHKDLGKTFPAFFFNHRPEVNSWMDCHTRVTVAYVHQLQNLYHALTGEELTLNGKG